MDESTSSMFRETIKIIKGMAGLIVELSKRVEDLEQQVQRLGVNP